MDAQAGRQPQPMSKFQGLLDTLSNLEARLEAAEKRLEGKTDVLVGTVPKPPPETASGRSAVELASVPNGVIESLTVSLDRLHLVVNSIHQHVDRLDAAGIGS